MPSQYSHSVVLAHYSSLGLIDLPNDQYLAYLKTYPTSKSSVPASKSKTGYGVYRSHGSTTSSCGSKSRRRYLDDHVHTSTSITPRREYSTRARNIVVDLDDASDDEHVIIHSKHKPPASQPPDQQLDVRDSDSHQGRRHSPSTYTARSTGSQRSPRPASTGSRPQPTLLAPSEPPKSQPAVINRNDRAATQDQSGRIPPTSRRESFSAPPVPPLPTSPYNSTRAEPEAGQPSAGARTGGPDASDTGLSTRWLSDRHVSQATITPSNHARSNSPPAKPANQVADSAPTSHPRSSISAMPEHQAKRVDSGAGFACDATTKPEAQPQPQRIRSYGSISSVTSEDMMHLTNAFPSFETTSMHIKPLQARRTRPRFTPKDAKVEEQPFEPSFLHSLGGGPTAVSPVSAAIPRSTPSQPHPVGTPDRPSLQGSQRSGDLATPNPDFWRDLEDLLSDSDASVVFPPDIAKHKPRTDSIAPGAAKDDKYWKKAARDTESKRLPTSAAPGPRPTTRDTTTDDGNDEDSLPPPERRGRSSGRLGNGVDALSTDGRGLTTVNLVDTSTPKEGGKRGFLNKLRKKNRTRREDTP